MLKDITLGQYFPGDTLAHRLDPRTKLLATVLYIIAIFLAKGPIAYGVLILTLIVSVRISKVGARALFRGLKPVLFIIAFTAVLNLFSTPGTVIAQFWIFHVTREGVITAIAMSFELAAYGAVAGLLYRVLPKRTGCIYVALIAAMVAGRLVWGAARYLLAGLEHSAFTPALFLAGAVTTALPGILLHIVLIPVLVMAMQKARLILN